MAAPPEAFQIVNNVILKAHILSLWCPIFNPGILEGLLSSIPGEPAWPLLGIFGTLDWDCSTFAAMSSETPLTTVKCYQV